MSEPEWTHLLDRASHWQREEVGGLIDELRVALEASRALEAALRKALAPFAFFARFLRSDDYDPYRIFSSVNLKCYYFVDAATALAASASTPAPPADDPSLVSVEVLDALRVVLPMAKGYAAAHPVGANAEKIAWAEQIIERTDPSAAPSDGETARRAQIEADSRNLLMDEADAGWAALRKEGE